jgi:hypothetical protein
MFSNFFSSILSLGKSNKKNKLGMHSNASVTDFAMPSASVEEVASQQKLRRTPALPTQIGGNSPPSSYHSIMQQPNRAFTIDAGIVYAETKQQMSSENKDWGSFLRDAGHNPDYQDKHFKAAREAKAKPVSPEVNPYKDNDIDKIIEHTGGDLDKLDSMFGLYTGVEKRK